jgi:DNA-binding NarL/FixJ family response regulator
VNVRADFDGTVLVADPDSVWRRSAVRALERVGYATIEASTGAQALDLSKRHRPGAVVLDLALSEVTAYEVCRELRETFGEGLPIVFVSAERIEPLDRAGGLLIGADDYVTKPCDPNELLARIRRLLPPRATRSPTAALADAGLTARETQVLKLLASGSSTQEIARKLFISVKTVSGHVQQILAKLGVHSQAQAVAAAYEAGLVIVGEAAPPGSLRRGRPAARRP